MQQEKHMANRDLPQRDLALRTPARSAFPFGRDPFTSLHRQIDRLFDDFLASTGSTIETAASGVLPSIDVQETEERYKVTAELPGLEQKDVQVELRDNALSISGEKRAEH